MNVLFSHRLGRRKTGDGRLETEDRRPETEVVKPIAVIRSLRPCIGGGMPDVRCRKTEAVKNNPNNPIA